MVFLRSICFTGLPYLYVDGSQNSSIAQQLVDSLKIHYQLIDLRYFKSTDVTAPRFVCDLGRFQGVEQIRGYVNINRNSLEIKI